ncbi:pectinesterase family protein [uncultured Hymenobacter sp.]|uniref:pectinesterase family protein n=1 Tax=uncultured Hymenobacter sp. TaxID=170016 RepID=UPI0035CA2792
MGPRAFGYDFTVAKDGTGDYTTVQAAIDAAPTSRTTVFTIFIENGRYKEKITIPANKPFLQLVGESVANTILTYEDGASTPAPGGGTLGTQNSASFSVNADDFSALNITFENSFGDGSQAVAVLLNADRAAFKNCRFLGNQDTLYTKGNGTPRHYFRDCYIDGNVDFIFGSSVAVFDRCVIYAKTRTSNGSSYITAANTPPGQPYGYVFRNCTLPANTGGTQYVLGRPWQNSTGFAVPTHNKVVFMKTTLGAGLIQPTGWAVWDAGTNTSLITYAEYESRTFSGNLVPVRQRVSWSRQLVAADTAAYTVTSAFGGTWNPCATAAGFCGSYAPEIAVSNFRATKGNASTPSTLSWNISWAMSQIKYELFRSSDNATFGKVGEVTALTDSLYNFQLPDAVPPAGSIYYYYLRASKAGLATHTTETIQVSSAPTLTATGTLGAFAQFQTGASGVQTYLLAGTNLTANVTITPPAGFEVSANGGLSWATAAAPLVLVPTSNTLANSISVRLNATAAGSYSGDIAHVSTGANAVSVPVGGTKVNTAAPVSGPLQWWPLKANSADSSAVRSRAVVASSPTLRGLTVSNGTTVPAIRAYSNTFGQAFGATPNGDGSWATTVGGPGGNLSRRVYEQFTVTAAANATVRLDSLLLTSAFYNTSSNTKLAVAYSRSNFTTDSADATGGTGPTGGLPSTANGAFLTPILLANQTGGPTLTYRLTLNNATGVSLLAGQTLTIRLYFSCCSTSAGRYALLKNVMVKGENTTVLSTNAKPLAGSSLSVFPNPAMSRLEVELSGYSKATELCVYNAVGRQVLRVDVPGRAGIQRTTLPLNQLPAGVYLLRARTEGGSDVRRIIKQ